MISMMFVVLYNILHYCKETYRSTQVKVLPSVTVAINDENYPCDTPVVISDRVDS